MLRDSLATPQAGYHVEQVEIIFSRNPGKDRISAAWAKTVRVTEALRTAFGFSNGHPARCHLTERFPPVEFHKAAPASWDSWRESDRCRPLLADGQVPWRVACWPSGRRMIWTFHHALLDGRSIARLLRAFLAILEDGNPPPLPRSIWHLPSAEAVELATGRFREMTGILATETMEFPDAQSPPGPALRCLGKDRAQAMDRLAKSREVTVPTLLTWAWGQAMAGFTGAGAVLVEQVRSGAPQPGTAGFTLNVLPLLIRKSGPSALPEFQEALLALRQIESVSISDFAAGVFPDVDGPGTSTIMVEHATLHHSVTSSDLIESITLHERKADLVLATAHLLPAFQLKVEGPHCHRLLELWTGVLDELAS